VVFEVQRGKGAKEQRNKGTKEQRNKGSEQQRLKDWIVETHGSASSGNE